jgi:solute carrier family 45 protein 1/2/4
MHAKIPHLPETATEVSEQDPLLGRSPEVESDSDTEDEASDSVTRPAGGTILGIHNLAIVMPQFIVSLVNLFP